MNGGGWLARKFKEQSLLAMLVEAAVVVVGAWLFFRNATTYSDVIIAGTCIVSWLAFKDDKLVDRLSLRPSAVDEKHEYWRLLSYGLVHASAADLLVNMVTLFLFGRAMAGLHAALLGPLSFVWFYAGALVVSALPTYIQNRRNPSCRVLGASGAVSAVLAAFVLLSPWSMVQVFVIRAPVPVILYAIAFLGYSIYVEERCDGSGNHDARWVGAAYGVVFTVLMDPRVVPLFLEQLAHPHL